MKFYKAKKAEIYTDGTIPARLFFEIMETQNYKLLIKPGQNLKRLRKPTAQQLYNAFDSIYDEHYQANQTQELKVMFRVKSEVLKQQTVIQLAKLTLMGILKAEPSKKQKRQYVKKFAKLGIKLQFTGDLEKDIHTCLQQSIGPKETKLKLDLGVLKTQSKAQRVNFDKNCVNIEGHGYTLDKDLTLRRYDAYNQAIRSAAKRRKAKKEKTGTKKA